MQDKIRAEEIGKVYVEKYGNILEALAQAFGETAGTGDQMGMLFLLESTDKIIRHADNVFREVYQHAGEA